MARKIIYDTAKCVVLFTIVIIISALRLGQPQPSVLGKGLVCRRTPVQTSQVLDWALEQCP